MKIRYKNFLFIGSALLLASCASDEPASMFPDTPSPLIINADISHQPVTRAEVDDNNLDNWSYTDFYGGDAMGFFSQGGNYSNGSDGTAPFVNQKLIYSGDGTKFTDKDGVQFSPTHMDGSKIFMYFPYTEDITGEYGFNLRVNPKDYDVDNDTVRCIDFLDASQLTLMGKDSNDKTVALYGQFEHAFAELIIMRGEGFDNPPQIEGIDTWKIKVVLDTPVTGLKVNQTDDPWSCTPELVFDETGELGRQEAMTWIAWLGQNFSKTEQDKIGQVAWYVIVPTIGSDSNVTPKKPGKRTIVEYIELYDNDGNLQRVSSLRLSNARTKYVDAGWRYPMEIILEDLVPTANPCNILPWNSDVDLTDERTRGINNETEFANFVTAYNEYLTNPDSEESISRLLKYGDLYKDSENNKYWHFYVLNDLDLSNYGLTSSSGSEDSGEGEGDQVPSTTNLTPIFPKFLDILDGQSTTLSGHVFINHKITGLQRTLVNSLEGSNASIQNFDFYDPTVINTTTFPAGIIANVMEGASVVNCNIENGTLSNQAGPGGMIAGSINGGLVKDCDLSGFLSVQSSANKIAGTVSGAPEFTNNDIKSVVGN